VQVSCVHVEATVGVHASSGDIDPVEETSVVAAHPVDAPCAIVAHASLHLDDAEDVLRRQLAISHRVVGVRQIINFCGSIDDPRTYPTVTENYLRNATFVANLRLLAAHSLVYDCHLDPVQLKEAAEVFSEALPDTPVVINHMGCPRRSVNDAAEVWTTWQEGIRACAALANAHVKLSNPARCNPVR